MRKQTKVEILNVKDDIFKNSKNSKITKKTPKKPKIPKSHVRGPYMKKSENRLAKIKNICNVIVKIFPRLKNHPQNSYNLKDKNVM